ncbi:MobF family relaxase [Aquaticitalea lipolytica]|nr:MobF family relaxase [Aquaticitalea lipolytica]
MIRMFQSQTSAQAKNYFKDALSKADYYIEDQEMNGCFHGKIAMRLGIEGKTVDKDTFDKLCDNINPSTGDSLTQRTVKDRRVGYDISFHCPKSVSILHGLGTDKRVLKAFEQSVQETMLDIQQDAQARIRVQNQQDDRHTGELLWADFIHQTARPVGNNAPDCHLHAHIFCFNATYDQVEFKFKAGQFHNIKRDMPYHQARFQKRLADKLSSFGYDIRKTKNGFELAMIPQKAIDHFSKRTNLIGQVAKEKGIQSQKELDQLGARTRSGKKKGLTMEELREDWKKQLIKEGIDENVKEEKSTTDLSLTAEKSIEHSIDHVFTRNSVKRDRQILAEGYKYAIDNKHLSLDDIDRALEKNDNVFKVQVGSQRLCTTDLVHKEERKMVNIARSGIGRLHPLAFDFDVSKFKHLNPEQQNVIKHVMKSQNNLTMIRGGAGTGKTTLLKTIVPEIERTGKNVFLFAPTAEASRDVLKKEGFKKADTVARLLIDKKLQEQTKGQVIWVDEAGMLGSQDMVALMDVAEKQKARLVLSGDPKQHSAVNRGDAMRILQTVAHIPYASMETIYRQKEEHYKSAVKDISEGNIKTGFDKLESQGCIKECSPSDIDNVLVNDFLESKKQKKTALVIAPTKSKVRETNQAIRNGLRENGFLGKREKNVTIYENLHLTESEKKDLRNYRKGQIIQLNQNLEGLKRGSALSVDKIENKKIYVKDKEGKHHILPTQRAKDYDVYLTREIQLSLKDEIKITKNGFDTNGKRLNNGTQLRITKVNRKGEIEVVKESRSKNTIYKLEANYGNFDYAYASTSHSAQGKTVDKVFISQPAVTFPASNQKQFYVSVSRARENVTIYTDDKEDLLEQIQKSGDRQGATELIKHDYFKTKTIDINPEKTREVLKTQIKDIDYEPEL